MKKLEENKEVEEKKEREREEREKKRREEAESIVLIEDVSNGKAKKVCRWEGTFFRVFIFHFRSAGY